MKRNVSKDLQTQSGLLEEDISLPIKLLVQRHLWDKDGADTEGMANQ